MIKKWFIILCGIVLIVGLGIRYEENLKDQLLNRVFQRLGLTAEYYRLRFVPLELELRNFSITPSKNVTIAGSRTYINVKWWPFLFREVRVRRLIIENPRIQVAADVSKQKKIELKFLRGLVIEEGKITDLDFGLKMGNRDLNLFLPSLEISH